MSAGLHDAAAAAAMQLRQGQGVAVVALVLSVLALALFARPLAGPAVFLRLTLIALTALSLYLFARVALDAAVFRRWASEPDMPRAMARFDAALARWRLRSATAPARGLPERIDGALRWRRALLACAAVQALCAAVLWISDGAFA